MRADIIIRSYLKDLPWLRYNLELLVKNWLEDSYIICELNRDCRPIVEQWAPNARIVYYYVDPWPDTYHFQMYCKMMSDQLSDAELIILVDSDVILMRRAGLEELLEDGKPVLHYLNWDETDPVSQLKWRPSTSKVMGMDLDRDYMVTTPFTFWRDTFPKTRDHIARVAGKPFEQVVRSDIPYDYRCFMDHPVIYSEHEALSLYAATYQAERYVVKHRPNRNWAFQLFWSHGWNPHIENQLQAALHR